MYTLCVYYTQVHIPQEDQQTKNKIQNDLRILTERLSRINESLARKVRAGSRPLRIALPCSANGRGAEPRAANGG